MELGRIYYDIEGKSPKEYCEVGQKVYLIPANNRKRYTSEIIEANIESVGRKYLTVNNSKYHADAGYIRQSGDYVSDYYLILSKEDLDYSIKCIDFSRLIDNFTSGYGIKKIDKISMDDKNIISEILAKYN